ncbi:MAG: hypothetical protein H8F28_06250 [Fibrella sp.]|nr:hypothetical protein [Armatimonadota bacterium]
MRRRQTAAPSLDTMDTAPAEATDTQTEPLASGSEANDSLQSDASAIITTSAEISDEPAPAKPRRTRRPKAVAIEETSAAPEGVGESLPTVAAEPEPVAETAPKRTRRPRRTASETGPVIAAPDENVSPPEPTTAPEEGVVAEPTDESVEPSLFEAIPDTLSVADAENEQSSVDSPSLSELLAESESILEEVIGETAPTERTSRNRRNNRRGRGRGGNGAETTSVETQEITPDSGPQRKRGPRVLARTLPLPALPVSADTAPATSDDAPAESSVPGRKRGIRVPRTMRRILTPDGVTIVTEAQAASLLGSVLVVSAEIGEGATIAPIAPIFAPVVPEYAPLPTETLERLPQVSVMQNNGVPELLVNGAPVLPAFLFVNTEVADEPEVAREIAVRQIQRAYASGVRLFTLLAHLPWKRKAGDRRFDSLDQVFALVAANAPDALVLPRLIFSPPASWERTNPDDMAAFANGEFGDVSIGSELFWKNEAKDALRAAIEHLAESEHAARTLGVYLEHGEWFQSKGVGADRSSANTAAFRAWLKYQYRNNEVALRSAWYDGSVTFDTAEIPAQEAFAAAASGNGTQPIFLTDREMRLSDFYAYTSTITADRIMQLGAIAKEASAGRLAVAASYGYTLEIARPNCGHYALGDVLSSPHVDILTAPLSYGGRLPGGSAPLPVPVDSIHLAGKLFVAEDDTKTHLALRPTEDVYNPKIATEEGTRAVHARNVGTALAKGCGISWMDLWGEGWLDDDATWEHLGSLVGLMGTVADMRRAATNAVSAPHVAIFVDEQSLFDMSGEEEPAILPQLIGRHRDIFARAGASVGFYLLSDLLKPEFPTTARLFIFLNAFHLPVAIRTALQNRWQNDGRTLAWLFAPGVRESGNIAELSETIGIQLRLQPWGSRTGTVVTEGRFALTENAKGERFGEEMRVNPSLTVVDPKAQILGEYTTSGNPSLAYRKHSRWQSVFIGERDLPLPLVRGLYRLAGVPIVTPDDDVVHVAGDGFAVVHSAQSGGMTLYSPTRSETAVYDVVSGEPLAGNGYGVRVQTSARATRLLLWATPDELSARFGLAPETWESAPPALTEGELPPVASAFVFESGNAVPPGPMPQRANTAVPQPTRLYPVELSVSAEDIAQFEAALAGEIALLDKEDETGVESEASRKKRRRRRRGGRGEKAASDAETDETSDDDEGGENETDIEAADAVFALADLTQGTTRFDADALLPLLFSDEAELPASPVSTVTPESPADDAPFDPVADMMARLFAQPGQLGEAVNPAPAELETVRRPTLDELLPFSEAPFPDVSSNDETPDTSDEQLESPTETEMVPLQQIPETEPVTSESEAPSLPDTPEAESEQPVGLLDSAVRGRRTRTAGAGGFTTRLRRRTPSEAPLDAGTATSNEPNESPMEGANNDSETEG